MKKSSMTLIHLGIFIIAGINCLAQDFPVRHTLTSDEKYIDKWPSFSPDGSKVVFARMQHDKEDSWKLYVLDLKRKEAECIISDTISLVTSRPNWSFDNRIAFSAVDPSKPNNSAIHSINYKSKEIEALTGPFGFLDSYPQWSKDNEWLTFIRLDSLTDFNLWKIVPGQKEVQLTNNEYYDAKSTISPDGKQIAFVSIRDTVRNIWIISSNYDDASVHQFTYKVGTAPAWSPNGKWIAYVSVVPDKQREGRRKYAIFVKNVLSKEIIQITDGSLNEMHPEWSRDGTRVIFDSRDGLDMGLIQYIEVDSYIYNN